MSTRLDQIMANTLLEVSVRKAAADFNELECKAALHSPRGFRDRLREISATAPAVIAEIKKASPSKGLIRADFHPAQHAREYESAGAACISVLTDETFFQGSLADLEAASRSVKIPCLRKDFMLDPFQVLEARAYGADAILLIVAALTDQQLGELRDEARRLGLDVLCEVHNPEELDRATSLGFELIGVNSRDLRTFVVRPELLFEIASSMPSGVTMVAESGLKSVSDIEKLRSAGYHGFLIGEALMREDDPGAALARLLQHEYARER